MQPLEPIPLDDIIAARDRISGTATIGLEILEDLPTVDRVLETILRGEIP